MTQEIEIVTIAESNEKALAIIQESELSSDEATSLKNALTPYFDQAEEWVEKAKALKVTDETQVEQMTQARTARLALKDIRVNLDKKRKELKEESLRKGKAIDGMANVLKFLIEPIEEYLEKQEKFVENREAERKAKLEEDRKVKLESLNLDPTFYQLADMPQATFDALVTQAEEAIKNKALAEKKAEEDRIAKEKADAEERAKVQAENDRLKKEAEQREAEIKKEREAKEKADEEARKKAEAEQKEKDRIAEEKRAEEARLQKIENDKLKAENEAKEKALKEEREAKAKLEREAKEKADSEKAEHDRKVAEAKAEADLKEKMSDTEKVKSIIDTLKAVRFPEMRSPEAKALVADLEMDITKMITKINNY